MWGTESENTVFTDHNFWRERRAKADVNQGPSAYQPNALPLGQTSSGVKRPSVSFVWMLQSLGPGSSLELCYSATMWSSCGYGSLFVCLRPSMFTVATMFPGSMFSILFRFMQVCLAPSVPISVCQSVSLCFSVWLFLPFSLSLSLSLSQSKVVPCLGEGWM